MKVPLNPAWKQSFARKLLHELKRSFASYLYKDIMSLHTASVEIQRRSDEMNTDILCCAQDIDLFRFTQSNAKPYRLSIGVQHYITFDNVLKVHLLRHDVERQGVSISNLICPLLVGLKRAA